MTAQKIFIGGRSEVPLICQQCGIEKSIPVSSIKQYGKPLRVKCRCGNIFSVIFETRAHYRKGTDLYGACYQPGSEKVLCDITVIDLSKTGVGFLLASKNVDYYQIKIGDILRIEFTLDDSKRTVVRTKITVRYASDKRVGAEFFMLDVHAAKQIGFYLIP